MSLIEIRETLALAMDLCRAFAFPGVILVAAVAAAGVSESALVRRFFERRTY